MRFAFVRSGMALLFSVTVFAAPPPSVILSRVDQRPIFISASAMTGADGTTAAVVPQDWRVRQQRIANAFAEQRVHASAFGVYSAAPCQGAMVVESEHEPLVDTTTQHKAIANAHAIIAGSIRSVTPGFFMGTPGSLIELDNLDKLKTDALYASVQDNIYIRLPYAHFATAGTEYCSESAPEAYTPKVGDRLLVFGYGATADTAGTFVYTSSGDVIAQPSGGAMRLPKSFSFFEDPQATLESLVRVIRSELSHRDKPIVHDGRTQ
jgi:hypothetical protein